MSVMKSVHEQSLRAKLWLLGKIYFRYVADTFATVYGWLFTSASPSQAMTIGYECSFCNEEFSNINKLRKHVKDVHETIPGEIPDRVIQPASLLLPSTDLLYRLEVREDSTGGMELYIDGKPANNRTLLEIFQEFKKLGYDEPQEIYWYLKGRAGNLNDNKIAYQYILDLARKTATPVHVTMSQDAPTHYPYQASATYQSYNDYSNDWRARLYNGKY